MKNINFFYLVLILLCLNLIGPSFTIAGKTTADITASPDTITFIHITDPHVCNLTGYHPSFVQKRQHFSKTNEAFVHFLKSVTRSYQADFVISTGDNIDYYEAETGEGGMLDTQVEQFTRLLDFSEVPVYLTLGNHDITSFSINFDSSIKHNQFNAERARAAWIRNASCFKNGSYYSRVVNIDTTSFRLIFLDNGYYSTEDVNAGLPQFIIDQSQLLWLDAQLNASISDIEIIFMHMPVPYGQSPDNSILTEPMKKYSSKIRYYNLLSVLEKNSSICLIFAGHKHLNKINNYILPNGNKLTQIMTGAFGIDSNNWRRIQLTNDKVIISYPGNSKTEFLITIGNR